MNNPLAADEVYNFNRWCCKMLDEGEMFKQVSGGPLVCLLPQLILLVICVSRAGSGLVNSQEWSISNFPCSPNRNITSHSRKNVAFHSSLRWGMIILPILNNSLIHFSLKCWENALFELGSERVKRRQSEYGKGENENGFSLPLVRLYPVKAKTSKVSN